MLENLKKQVKSVMWGLMPKYNSLMLDIETLGTTPGCVVLSIGAAFFNEKNGRITYTFKQNIELESSEAIDLKIDASTLKWWLNQKAEVFESLFENTKSVHESLKLLSDFIKNNSDESLELWCNGYFDVAILDHVYKKIGLEVPWKYYQVRDVRTVSMMNKDIRKDYPKPKMAHDALEDCFYQIGYLCETLKTIQIVNQAGKPTDRITIESNLYQIPNKEK